jgi:hypothetical protein
MGELVMDWIIFFAIIFFVVKYISGKEKYGKSFFKEENLTSGRIVERPFSCEKCGSKKWEFEYFKTYPSPPSKNNFQEWLTCVRCKNRQNNAFYSKYVQKSLDD